MEKSRNGTNGIISNIQPFNEIGYARIRMEDSLIIHRRHRRLRTNIPRASQPFRRSISEAIGRQLDAQANQMRIRNDKNQISRPYHRRERNSTRSRKKQP